jgi:citrate synthase
MLDELELMESVERLTPEVFFTEKDNEKVISANVDMYSGLIYRMLDIPVELYTLCLRLPVWWAGARTESRKCTTLKTG